MVSRKCAEILCETRWHRESTDPSLTGKYLSGTFFYPRRIGLEPGEADMIYPSLTEVKKRIVIHPESRRIPLSLTLNADMLTPCMVMRRLMNADSHCFLLESAESVKTAGRYSFLGYAPEFLLTVSDGCVTVRDRNGQPVSDGAAQDAERNAFPGRSAEHEDAAAADGSPADTIRRILAANRTEVLPGMPPFTGGLVGYFSYDFIKYSEPSLSLDALDEEHFRDADLMFFDRVIVFDSYEQKVTLICSIRTDQPDLNYLRGEQTLREMKALMTSGGFAKSRPLHIRTPFKPMFDEPTYCAMVEKARHYIHEGDIFQVVLSNRFEAEMEGSLFDTYRLLRMANPSPYMFYFSGTDVEIAGASPETLVKLENGILKTFPLAGTRPRGRTEEEDRKLEKELLADEKECAEHSMLVDLGRNDVGKISIPGSVRVERYMDILKFSHVMHIGSAVTGEIAKGRDAVDALSAVLPAGTLSGAPKIRACQIINELENSKRGIYGGAVGYIDTAGNLDTAIGIRLAYAKNGKVFVRSGAGIVADSVPEREYQECLNKARAVMEALSQAEGGIDDDSSD